MILEATRSNAGHAGSMGAHWPPRYEAHNNRVKGFATFKVDNLQALGQLRSEVRSAERETPHSTRTTVRAFVSRDMLESLNDVVDLEVEACIPADNIFPNFDLVYLGRNSRERIPEQEVLESEKQAVSDIQGIPLARRDAAMERTSEAGYCIGVCVDFDAHLDRLLELYGEAFEQYAFELNADTISSMFINGNVVLTALDREGRVASSMVAEHAIVGIDGKDVHLYELSDYATFLAHQGKGLMTHMQIEAIRMLRSMHGDEAIIYAEDRASWTPVNISSQKAGMRYAGTLPKHCRLKAVRDLPEVGDLENLNVWFAPGGMSDV